MSTDRHSASRMIGMQELAQLQAPLIPKNTCHVPNWPPHLVPCSRSTGRPPTAGTDHQPCNETIAFLPITPAHRKPPWPGYKHGLRLFTKLLVAHPLVGVCLPPEIRPAEYLKLTGYMVGSLFIRGHSAGFYAGMVWETILAEFPDIEGKTVLAAIALPPSLLTTPRLSHKRQVHLIHHADDRLCVWTPSNQDMRMLQHQGFIITHITGWRAYLGTAQHNYPHWTRVTLPQGRQDLAKLESSPGVLPFEVYSQAPLRLISWCSFELPQVAKRLLRELAVMCEAPETTTQELVNHIAMRNPQVRTEQDATQYLASLATVSIASRANLLNYTTMVQHFLGTLQLPMAVYMLDYYLPMLSPNEGSMRQDLRCRVLAQFVSHGKQSNWNSVQRQ